MENNKNDITFQKITKDNLNEIGDLKVLPNQVGYSNAGNWKIIAESNYYEDAWIRGIYINNKPIGLIMLSLWEPEEWYAIWKLMIDYRYQKMGFGKKVVEMAILNIKKMYPSAKIIRLTCRKKDKDESPYEFYTKIGFIENGEEVNEDIVLIKNI